MGESGIKKAHWRPALSILYYTAHLVSESKAYCSSKQHFGSVLLYSAVVGTQCWERDRALAFDGPANWECCSLWLILFRSLILLHSIHTHNILRCCIDPNACFEVIDFFVCYVLVFIFFFCFFVTLALHVIFNIGLLLLFFTRSLTQTYNIFRMQFLINGWDFMHCMYVKASVPLGYNVLHIILCSFFLSYAFGSFHYFSIATFLSKKKEKNNLAFRFVNR